MVFDVPYAPEEATQLLGRAVKCAWIPYLTRQGLVGTVRQHRVCVWRHRPFDRNSFMPVFSGAFETQGGGTKLTGGFHMHRAARAFVCFWFLGVLALYLAAAYTVSTEALPMSGKLFFFGVPTFFLVFGVALFHFGWWAARNDVEYVSSRIANALRRDGT